MYDGVPSIRMQGDATKCFGLIPAAKTLLGKVQRVRERMGVGTYGLAERVDDDSYIYCLCKENQNIMFIVSSPTVVVEEPEIKLPEFPTSVTPQMYSGIVLSGSTIIDGPIDPKTKQPIPVLHAFHPTPACATIREISPAKHDEPGLAVVNDPTFQELMTSSSATDTFSQYKNLKPTMYSGYMAQAVSAVMGLGTLSEDVLIPDGGTEDSLDDEETEYYKSVKASGFQVRYDYRFFRTHGIVRVGDDFWLVEAGINHGVLARPLPYIPGTDEHGFAETADSDIAAVVEALGGVPSGMTFSPNNNTRAKQIADGDILQLMTPTQMHDFYRLSPYSSAMGWCFGKTQTMAHNTGLELLPQETFYGYHYGLDIRLSAINRHRTNGQPIGTGSAGLHKLQDGNLWEPPVRDDAFVKGPKFYEPLTGCLESVSFRPSTESVRRKILPFCDTRVHVFFFEDQLYTVSWYYDALASSMVTTGVDGEIPPDGFTVGTECPVPGSWERTTYANKTGVLGGFYTTSHDDLDVGFTSRRIDHWDYLSAEMQPGVFGDFITSLQFSFVIRNRRARVNQTTTLDGGRFDKSMVAIPAWSREAVYYVWGEAIAQHQEFGQSYNVFYGDPNIGFAWRFLSFQRGSHPTGVIDPPCGLEDGARCGSLHRDRKIFCLTKAGGLPCSDYADQGEWLSMCQSIDQLNDVHGNPPPATHFSSPAADIYRVKSYLIANWGGGEIQLNVPASHIVPDNVEWAHASGSTTDCQFIGTTWATLGEPSLAYYTDLASPGGKEGAWPYGSDNSGAVTYIGVNGG